MSFMSISCELIDRVVTGPRCTSFYVIDLEGDELMDILCTCKYFRELVDRVIRGPRCRVRVPRSRGEHFIPIKRHYMRGKTPTVSTACSSFFAVNTLLARSKRGHLTNLSSEKPLYCRKCCHVIISSWDSGAFRLSSTPWSLWQPTRAAVSRLSIDMHMDSKTSNKQRVLMHRHQGLNVRHGLCHIYMRYLYIYELFIAFVCFVVCSLL